MVGGWQSLRWDCLTNLINRLPNWKEIWASKNPSWATHSEQKLQNLWVLRLKFQIRDQECHFKSVAPLKVKMMAWIIKKWQVKSTPMQSLWLWRIWCIKSLRATVTLLYRSNVLVQNQLLQGLPMFDIVESYYPLFHQTLVRRRGPGFQLTQLSIAHKWWIPKNFLRWMNRLSQTWWKQ